MRCGILTFFGIPNYGAVLQAYALCASIRRMDIDCEMIDYTCENIVSRELIRPEASNPVRDMARAYIWKKYRVPRIRRCRQFTQSRGMMSAESYDKNNISTANEKYDVFISGSDMIWDSGITGNDLTYYLQFADDNKKRIAYGSSDGSGLSRADDEIFGLLKKYSMIGVRESNVCRTINEHGIDCSLVADPTMLITADEWSSMCADVKERGYVLVYFPGDEILEAAYRYAKEKHLRLLVISDVNKRFTKYRCLHISDPAEWLSYIKNADAVFTDSYHGVLFSLYFNRIFFTNKKGNRVDTVLEKFRLQNRYISDASGADGEIDYTDINARIETFRNESLMFLKKALSL